MDCSICGEPAWDCLCMNEAVPEPSGFLGATAHDFDDHRACDPRSCPNAEVIAHG